MKLPKEIKFYNLPQAIFFGLIETRSNLFKRKESKFSKLGFIK